MKVKHGLYSFKTVLEFAGPVYALLWGMMIVCTAAAAMLMHRLEIMVTHADLRARPVVGFRFHVVQVSSVALYLGLAIQGVAWSMNHRSIADPLLYKALGSPLLLLPACVWLLLRPALRRNRDASRRKMYGNATRALGASIVSTTMCVAVLVALHATLK